MTPLTPKLPELTWLYSSVVTLSDVALSCGCLVGLAIGFLAVVAALVWVLRWVR